MNANRLLLLLMLQCCTLADAVERCGEQATQPNINTQTRPTLSTGSRSKGNRIIGGTTALNCSYPWQAAIIHRGDQICGGSILDRRFVVTAAHCLPTWASRDHYEVAVGSNTIPFQSGQIIRVERLITHPDYRTGYFYLGNDIMLAKLAQPIEFNDCTMPICLPTSELANNAVAIVIGWGETKTNYTPHLKQLAMRKMDYRTCFSRTYYGRHGYRTPRAICARHPTSAGMACHGDSGGPLMARVGERFYLYGVASYVAGGCVASFPAVFTNVAAFAPWIQRTMQANL